MTQRQFMTWRAWTTLDLNKQDKLDHYLIQIATEVRRSAAKNARSVRHEHLTIKFETPFTKKRSEPVADRSARAKERAIRRVGGKVVVVQAPPPE